MWLGDKKTWLNWTVITWRIQENYVTQHPLDNVHGYCLDSFSQFVYVEIHFHKAFKSSYASNCLLGDLSVYNSRLKWFCELVYLVLCIVMFQVCRKRELKCFLKVSSAIKKKSHHSKLGCTYRFSVVLITSPCLSLLFSVYKEKKAFPFIQCAQTEKKTTLLL